MNIKVTKIHELQNEMRALQARLDSLRLPPLELSSVYTEGMAYGFVYEDGRGNIETLSDMHNRPDQLAEIAKKECKKYPSGKLYIVGFKPVVIHSIIESDEVS